MGIPYKAGRTLRCAEIREIDRRAIEEFGIPGIVLMENAGRAVAEVVYDGLKDARAARVVVLCGTGNNGGDGFVVARHLHNARVDVAIVLAGAAEKSRGDAGANLSVTQRMGIDFIAAYEPSGRAAAVGQMASADVIVDALLGTGTTGAPRGSIAELIEAANDLQRARRIAIDVPSGLDADTGAVHRPCFRADVTVTMVARKAGFYEPAAAEVLGEVVVVDIGAPRVLLTD